MTGVDAWRLDAAYAVPPAFWRDGAARASGSGTPTSGWSARSSTATTPATSPVRRRLGDPVRAVEGGLELAERPQPVRAGPRAAPARRDGPRLPAADVRRQPRRHPAGQPARRPARTCRSRWPCCSRCPACRPSTTATSSAWRASRRTAPAGTTRCGPRPARRRRGRATPRRAAVADVHRLLIGVRRRHPWLVDADHREPDVLRNEVLAVRLTGGGARSPSSSTSATPAPTSSSRSRAPASSPAPGPPGPAAVAPWPPWTRTASSSSARSSPAALRATGHRPHSAASRLGSRIRFCNGLLTVGVPGGSGMRCSRSMEMLVDLTVLAPQHRRCASAPSRSPPARPPSPPAALAPAGEGRTPPSVLPLPDDLTVRDPGQLTGRRVRPADTRLRCGLRARGQLRPRGRRLDQLDGFDMDPRLTVRFSAPVDPGRGRLADHRAGRRTAGSRTRRGPRRLGPGDQHPLRTPGPAAPPRARRTGSRSRASQDNGALHDTFATAEHDGRPPGPAPAAGTTAAPSASPAITNRADGSRASPGDAGRRSTWTQDLGTKTTPATTLGGTCPRQAPARSWSSGSYQGAELAAAQRHDPADADEGRRPRAAGRPGGCGFHRRPPRGHRARRRLASRPSSGTASPPTTPTCSSPGSPRTPGKGITTIGTNVVGHGFSTGSWYTITDGKQDGHACPRTAAASTRTATSQDRRRRGLLGDRCHGAAVLPRRPAPDGGGHHDTGPLGRGHRRRPGREGGPVRPGRHLLRPELRWHLRHHARRRRPGGRPLGAQRRRRPDHRDRPAVAELPAADHPGAPRAAGCSNSTDPKRATSRSRCRCAVEGPVDSDRAGCPWPCQDYLAEAAWLSRPGGPETFSPLIQPKRAIFQVAFGNQTCPTDGLHGHRRRRPLGAHQYVPQRQDAQCRRRPAHLPSEPRLHAGLRNRAGAGSGLPRHRSGHRPRRCRGRRCRRCRSATPRCCCR